MYIFIKNISWFWAYLLSFFKCHVFQIFAALSLAMVFVALTMKLLENDEKASRWSKSTCKIVINKNEIRLTRWLGWWKENWAAVVQVCLT